MLEMLIEVLPEFVKVTATGELETPTGMFPKATEVGENDAVDPSPVPESATVCGVPTALSAIEIVPGWLPVAVGLKLTEMVQLALTARVAPQVVVFK